MKELIGWICIAGVLVLVLLLSLSLGYGAWPTLASAGGYIMVIGGGLLIREFQKKEQPGSAQGEIIDSDATGVVDANEDPATLPEAPLDE